MIFIASQSLGNGLKGGIAATFGVSFGILFHILALSFGLSQLLILYPWLLHTIKILGVTYLLFLAFKAFKNAYHPIQVEARPILSTRKIFAKGALTNVTNPKVALFFLAFIPQFVKPTNGKIFYQILLLGFSFLSLGTCTNFLYAFLFCKAANKFKDSQNFQKILGNLTGIIFLGLAFKLLI